MGKVIPMLGGGGSGADLDMITATAADVRAGKVIVDKEGNPVTGTEPERGAWNGAVGMNAQVAIPEGTIMEPVKYQVLLLLTRMQMWQEVIEPMQRM